MSQRSSYTEGTPCWVDLQTTDLAAAKEFYGVLFGWSFDDQPIPGGGVYSMAVVDGDTVAAVTPQSPEMAANHVPPMWNTYIAVDDVDAAHARAVAAGGHSMMEPFDVMEAGRMAWVSDPSGAAVGLWQAGQHIGATRVNEPNALTWNELVSSDTAAALPFYEALAKITTQEVPMGDVTYTMLYVGEAMIGGATAPEMEGLPNHWRVWFAVADTDQAVAAASAAGGQVLLAPMDMAIGRIAALADPQGAAFSVIAMNAQQA
jgi:predicted enzyme related to lactoylglutathione lyase